MYVKRQGKGWQVQVPGKPSKFFSDDKHGGRAAARAKAAGHARRLADRGRVNPETGRFVRDPSGSEGVFRLVVTRGERQYAFWVAEADLTPGKKTQRRFSVGKYGEIGAKREARAARAAMVKELLGGK